MKKLISLILFMLFISSSFSAFAQSDDVMQLSLEDAVKMAMDYSPDIECSDVNKNNLEKQVKSASLSKRQSQSAVVYMSQNAELLFVKEGYYLDAANSQLRLWNFERKKIEETIAYNTVQKYFTYKNALSLQKIAQNALERAQTNKDIILKQFEIGMCTELDVKNADITLKQCSLNCEKADNSCNLALESLKIYLGIESDVCIVPTDSIEVEKIDTDLEKDTENAIKSRYDANALKESADLSVKYLDIANAFSLDNTTYTGAYTNKVKSIHAYNTGVKNISLLIKSAYYNLKECEKASEIAKEKLDYSKSNYEVNKIRYEMGMISSVAFNMSSDDLTSAENSYENALLNQKLAKEKYCTEISSGL